MKEITAEALKKRLDSGEDIVLIDVREPYEHEEFNIGGELIPLAEIVSHAERLKEMEGKDIVFYCRSGNRSSMAQKMLAVQGIKNTLSLRGGMNSWRDM